MNARVARRLRVAAVERQAAVMYDNLLNFTGGLSSEDQRVYLDYLRSLAGVGKFAAEAAVQVAAALKGEGVTPPRR